MSSSDAQTPGRLPTPTLRQLQFLVALKHNGGFVKAADAVGVTQPTLSAGIKELEGLLGVVLVDRSRTGAALTPAGEEAAARALGAIEQVEELVRAVRDAARPLSGAFRLGAIPTVAPFLLPRALGALRAHFPQVRLHLREDLTHRLIDALHARTLDAALIALPYEAEGIEVEVIGEDEFLLVTPLGHRLSEEGTLEPSQIAGEDLLLLEDGHCLREHALALCRLAPGRRSSDVSATSLHTLVQMVGAGLGLTLLPRLAARGGAAAGADVEVRAFTRPLVGRAIGVAWRAGSPRTEDARRLAQTLKAVF